MCNNENGDEILVCSRRELNHHPPIGLVSSVRIVLNESGDYDFQVLMISKSKGTLKEFHEYKDLLDIVSCSGGYKFCPGFHDAAYEAYFDVIRYDPKGVRRTTQPIARIDSNSCLLWHKLARNASIFEKDMESVMCSSCKRLRNILEQQVKRISSRSPSKKVARVQPSSNYPLKFLSPKSVEKKQKIHQERTHDKKLLNKFSGMDVALNDLQNEEMTALVNKITEIGSEEVKSAIEEGEKHQCGIGSTIKAIWDNDVAAMKKEFNVDQKENSL